MSSSDHPFSDGRIAEVVEEHGVDDVELDEALARVQQAIARDRRESAYEYSSQHNFGWEDENAFYLYGDGIWETLREELSLSTDLVGAAREVHRRAMLESAEARDNRESVEEQFAEGVEPLVVTNTGREPPLFGQDV
jgi:hypothetical protein